MSRVAKPTSATEEKNTLNCWLHTNKLKNLLLTHCNTYWVLQSHFWVAVITPIAVIKFMLHFIYFPLHSAIISYLRDATDFHCTQKSGFWRHWTKQSSQEQIRGRRVMQHSAKVIHSLKSYTQNTKLQFKYHTTDLSSQGIMPKKREAFQE